MVSPWERDRLAGIERRFEAEDPALAKALRDAVPPHRPARAVTCVAVDLVGAGMFVTSVVMASFLLLMASVVVVAAALGAHILLPPCGRS
jgi:DUF3040 family protein